ncbi:hydrolase 1, exosortase A system-associated [Magnetospira thiophila]
MSCHVNEQPLVIPCAGAQMIGLLHRPEVSRDLGVVVVVGGPQIRAGTHRQYVLLARELAASGTPVLRFDVRGQGDSTGDFGGFEQIQPDIGAAVAALRERVPEVRRVALLGLCDGATASAFYALTDDRITDLVLINPWVRSEATLAQAHVRHYYVRRFLSRAFWRKLLFGGVNVWGALGEFRRKLHTARKGSEVVAQEEGTGASLADRMTAALRKFDGRVLLILSGADVTAQEFETAVLRGNSLARHPRMTVLHVAGANHTYSLQVWRRQVHDGIADWLSSAAQ